MDETASPDTLFFFSMAERLNKNPDFYLRCAIYIVFVLEEKGGGFNVVFLCSNV